MNLIVFFITPMNLLVIEGIERFGNNDNHAVSDEIFRKKVSLFQVS